MAFTGNLEDLAVVDVIQLLHSARKSGTLCVKYGDRESQLVFSEGFIISANHADSSVRIGRILVEMQAVTPAVLDQALRRQETAGAARKPLIGMLIENGQITREKASKGLEILIEMTIVEMVSWPWGTFTLDVDQIIVSDEYRYFPETLQQEMTLDTQMVLMDALRIYDEKKRDGEIGEEGLNARTDRPPAEVVAEATPNDASAGINADDLGLGDIDRLEARIPKVFSGLEAFDPADLHRQALARAAAGLPPEQIEDLAAYLAGLASGLGAEQPSRRNHRPQALLLFSRDELLRHLLMTVGKHDGMLVFVAETGEKLFAMAEQVLGKGMRPLLVCDCPAESGGEFAPESLGALHRKFRQRFALLPLVQLVATDQDRFAWQAYRDGVNTIFPRPTRGGGGEDFAATAISFLKAFRTSAHAGFQTPGEQLIGRLHGQLAGLQGLKEAPAVAQSLLRSVADQFARALTLVVGKTELIAERGIGLAGSGGDPAPAPTIRIPLDRPSVFRRVIEEGRLLFGPCDDPLVREHLAGAIGAPLRPVILLLPLQSFGKSVSLTYADFGAGEPAAVAPESLAILARQAGLVLENALYRKRLGKAD